MLAQRSVNRNRHPAFCKIVIESGPQDFYACQSIRPKAPVSASRGGPSVRVMSLLLAWFKNQLPTLVGVLPSSSLGSFSAILCRLTLSLPISFPNLYEPANSFPREYWSASDVLAPELSAPPPHRHSASPLVGGLALSPPPARGHPGSDQGPQVVPKAQPNTPHQDNMTSRRVVFIPS